MATPGDLTTLLNQLTGSAPVPAAEPGPPRAPEPDDMPEPAFTNLAAFVDDYLLQVVERRIQAGPVSGVFWCTSWWAHPEGLSRIYALWREWEKARVDDTMSVWWLHHLDPHIMSLTAEYGPFSKCEPGKHTTRPVSTLQGDPMPADVLAQLPEG